MPSASKRSWFGAIDAAIQAFKGHLDESSQQRNIFAPYEPPPGVLPKGKTAKDVLAMDEAGWSGIDQWAWNAYSQIASEGLTFLGYPYLSELAQRPEYRVISETIAVEMTRKWIKLNAKGDSDKSAQISELNDFQDELHLRENFAEVAEIDGFFGRAHLFLDFGTDLDGDPKELAVPIGTGRDEMSKGKVGKKSKLKRLEVIEPIWTYPQAYNGVNPLKEDWYEPQKWFVMGKEVHTSRIPTFIGRPVPDIFKPAYAFGGLARSQMAKPYVDYWLKNRTSVGDIINAFSVFVLKTDMSENLIAGGDKLWHRLNLFNMTRDNAGVLAVDKNTEDFTNISAPLGTLDSLLAQSQEHMASVSRIPLVKLLGISPHGLNASTEGELRTFYDTILAYQQRFFADRLRSILDFMMISLWGKVDDDITFEFEPLWSLDEKGAAEVQKTKAETGQILIDSGAISQGEERKRVATDPLTAYPGLDVEELPDLREEEEEGLEPEGGRPQPLSEIGPAAGDAAITVPLMLIRHGATSLNNDDVSVDRIRGHIDVPLSKEGKEEAERLGEKLVDDDELPDLMFSSSLKRAHDTAKIISEITGVKLQEATKAFTPWDVGKYAGEISSKAIPILADFAENKPDEKLEGGESFNDFRRRSMNGLATVLQKYNGLLAIVTHHRDERLWKAWLAGGAQPNGDIDIKTFNQKGEATGHVEIIDIPLDRLVQAAQALGKE